MWYRNQGTITATTGSNVVIMQDVDITRPELQVGFGLIPDVDGLPLYEMTAFNFGGGDLQVTIQPEWKGPNSTVSFAIAPMLGQNREMRVTLEEIKEFLHGLKDGNLLSSLSVGDGAGNTLFSVTNEGINLNAPLDGSIFLEGDDDRTPGLLLRTGDQGSAGIPVAIDSQFDFNTLVAHGKYLFSGSDAPANSPIAAGLMNAGGTWMAEVDRRSTALVIQRAWRLTTASGAGSQNSTNRVWRRTRSTSGGIPTASEWIEEFTSGRIVGELTSDAITRGVNLGLWNRVLETGSNANGRYVRFAGGVQVCWKRDAASADLVSNGSVFSGSGVWTFPAPFIETTDLVVKSSSASLARWGGSTTDITTTEAVLRHFGGSDSGTATGMRGFAVGRYA